METKKKPQVQVDFSLSPLEERVAIKPQNQQLFLGVPKERLFQEKRVVLSPSSVSLLVNNGHRVLIETGAGDASKFTDHQYSEAGAEIAYDKQKVYSADILLKVTPLVEKELELLKTHQTVLSPIHLPTLKEDFLRRLMQKKITALAFEYIKDEAKNFPFVRTLSEIAGYNSILIASEYLSDTKDGYGIIMGGVTGVPPTKVVILGAGVVGEFAARAALGLGAEVKIFDYNIYKLMRLQNNIGQRVFTSVLDPEILANELATTNVAIGAIHAETGSAPVIVPESMVANMKPGAVIIDVSIDQGGCFETSELTTHKAPSFISHEVVHYCVPNIASRVPRTASLAISNVLTPILLNFSKYNNLDGLLRQKEGIRHGVYLYKGALTNNHLSRKFHIKDTDLNLLMTAGI